MAVLRGRLFYFRSESRRLMVGKAMDVFELDLREHKYG